MLGIPPGLDPDLLRSFVLIAEGGSFTRAAQAVGRTQSAVSMQIRRLEETLGQPLLLRSARGVEPTRHGQWLLEHARRLLALHDEIHATFRQPVVAGPVRLGSPDDYAIRWLPGILAGFAAAHPAVQVEVTCAPSHELVERLEEGELDLTLISEGNEPPGARARWLWRGPLLWVGRPEVARRRPVPLALASGGCSWRMAALTALEAAELPWRMTYTAASLSGSLAVALAGLAVTVSMPTPLPDGVRQLGAEEGLPPLPDFAIGLLRGPGSTVAEALARHIEESFRLDGALAAPVRG